MKNKRLLLSTSIALAIAFFTSVQISTMRLSPQERAQQNWAIRHAAAIAEQKWTSPNLYERYGDLMPKIEQLQEGLIEAQEELKQLGQKIENLVKKEIQPQKACFIEADGCTEEKDLRLIPCKNHHPDLICNPCLNQIKEKTNRCPLCQEPLL